jgi:hypothetical protein
MKMPGYCQRLLGFFDPVTDDLPNVKILSAHPCAFLVLSRRSPAILTSCIQIPLQLNFCNEGHQEERGLLIDFEVMRQLGLTYIRTFDAH